MKFPNYSALILQIAHQWSKCKLITVEQNHSWHHQLQYVQVAKSL